MDEREPIQFADERQVTFEEIEHRAKLAVKKKEEFWMKIMRVALDALSERIVIFFSLSGSAALFAWSMVDPSVLRLISASIFTGMTFLPALFKGARKNAD